MKCCKIGAVAEAAARREEPHRLLLTGIRLMSRADVEMSNVSNLRTLVRPKGSKKIIINCQFNKQKIKCTSN